MSTTGVIPQWDLGDRLAKALRHAGVSNARMAEELGSSPNTVGNYIAGRTKPSRGDVMVWAHVTGVNFTWLWTGEAPSDLTSTTDAPDPAKYPQSSDSPVDDPSAGWGQLQ